ncbi:ankyrin repeat domain-containing protein 27-like [Mytilus trossulus]|uniref:ankyrin repeat domain-containing protein 27-like n=1 Tax=Mytilus trossulus TaxID=6551 RepID=UPI003005E817
MTTSLKKYQKPSNQRGELFDFFYIRSLVNLMSNNEEKFDDDTDGRMLFDAIRKGKQHLVRFILEASPGNIVNARDFNGKTPLIVACTIKEELRRTSVSRLLLFHGGDVNLADDNGRTPLSYACEKRCNDLVEVFVKHRDIDPDTTDDKGNSPLLYCTMVGNDIGTNSLVRHFRRLGLKVDNGNKEGFTPIVMAARNGFISCARILFQQGQASLYVRDPVNNLTVEELLEKNGFTLDDLLPFERQQEAKRRFKKVITFAKLMKGLSSSRQDTVYDRSAFPRRSLEPVTDKFDKERFPPPRRSNLRSVPLPPVKLSPKVKTKGKGKMSLRRDRIVSKPNGTAVIPAICSERRSNKGFPSVSIQAYEKFCTKDSSDSDNTEVETCSENDEESDLEITSDESI